MICGSFGSGEVPPGSQAIPCSWPRGIPPSQQQVIILLGSRDSSWPTSLLLVVGQKGSLLANTFLPCWPGGIPPGRKGVYLIISREGSLLANKVCTLSSSGRDPSWPTRFVPCHQPGGIPPGQQGVYLVVFWEGFLLANKLLPCRPGEIPPG